ncbi:hypothetical protein [Ferruginibacter profundus]
MAVYVFSATAVGELLKLPLLVMHYYDHREENKAIQLTQFLFMHYSREDGTDKDAKEDSRLPFKSSAVVTAAGSFVSIIPDLNFTLLTRPVSTTNSFGTYVNLLLPCRYADAIWQPPRFC